MKTNKEKQLTIALLTEKLQKVSGKKVTFVESAKSIKIKQLKEKLEQVSGKKVTFAENELDEAFFGPSKEDFQKTALQTINLWVPKGYKRPDQAAFNAIMQQAEADKFKGKLGVDKDKNIIYRPTSTIPVKGATSLIGGGQG